jgi:hypothetical protein
MALATRPATMNRPAGVSRCLIGFCISSLHFPFFDSSWSLLLGPFNTVELDRVSMTVLSLFKPMKKAYAPRNWSSALSRAFRHQLLPQSSDALDRMTPNY